VLIVPHDNQPWEESSPGVHSRAWAAAASGARQVRIGEQTLEPGCEMPLHWHYCEENITVMSGVARMAVAGELAEVGSGETVIIPSLDVHAVRNAGDNVLRIITAMGWPIDEMNYVDRPGEIWRAGETVGRHGIRRLGSVLETAPRAK
jgi:quercetin dioxygenase-like cupin family protein